MKVLTKTELNFDVKEACKKLMGLSIWTEIRSTKDSSDARKSIKDIIDLYPKDRLIQIISKLQIITKKCPLNIY